MSMALNRPIFSDGNLNGLVLNRDGMFLTATMNHFLGVQSLDQ